MTREIKFRAWEKEEKEMCEVIAIHWFEGGSYTKAEIQYDNGNISLRFPGSLEFMQFTGLKDKNGKEIYEGDIVQAMLKKDSEYEESVELKFRDNWRGNQEVKWNDEFCCYNIGNKNYSFEIIGNIWENPKLLK